MSPIELARFHTQTLVNQTQAAIERAQEHIRESEERIYWCKTGTIGSDHEIRQFKSAIKEIKQSS